MNEPIRTQWQTRCAFNGYCKRALQNEMLVANIYTALLLSGELDSHLSEVDTRAETMFFQLVKRLAEREGITEQLKAEDQMEWVRQMNSVRKRAEEVICDELIYA